MSAFSRPVHSPRFAPSPAKPDPATENMAVYAADMRRKQRKLIRDIKAYGRQRDRARRLEEIASPDDGHCHI